MTLLAGYGNGLLLCVLCDLLQRRTRLKGAALSMEQNMRDSQTDLSGHRVRLRQWIDRDLPSFIAMNADPVVMEFFPSTLSPDESTEAFHRLRRRIDDAGWGLWAVEVDGEFAGLTGLAEPKFEAQFTPCVEVGWRFHRRFWGQGLALESARIAVQFAFTNLRLDQVVAFTAFPNKRSQRLMQRLGMIHSPSEDFDHPAIPADHPLCRHVLYRLVNSSPALATLHNKLAQAPQRTSESP